MRSFSHSAKSAFLVAGLLSWLLVPAVASAKTRMTSKPEDHPKDGNEGLIVEIKDVNLYKVENGFLFAVKLEFSNESTHDSDLEDVRMFLQTNSGPVELMIPMTADGSLPKMVTGKKGSYAFPGATAVTRLSPLVLASEKRKPAIKVGDSLNTDIPFIWKKGQKMTLWVWGNYLYEPGSKDELTVETFDFRRTAGKLTKKPRLRASVFLSRFIKAGPNAARSNPLKPTTP